MFSDKKISRLVRFLTKNAYRLGMLGEVARFSEGPSSGLKKVLFWFEKKKGEQ